MSLFRKIVRKIKTPGCLYGPAQFFSSREESPAHLHRKLFYTAKTNLPGWLHILVCIAGALFWYCFHFWQQLFRVYRYKLSGKHQIRRCKSIFNELSDLIYIGLWLGVDPYQYYRFRLYLHQRRRWLYRVFEQEQSIWHLVHSIDKQSSKQDSIVKLLSDKYQFEKHLEQHQIPTTKTLAYLQNKTEASNIDLFSKRDLFLKPNSSNAMRGCLGLRYQKSSDSYELSGRGFDHSNIRVKGKEQIGLVLNQCFERSEYLLQERLKNAKQLCSFFGFPDHARSELITIRLITYCSSTKNSERDVGLAYQILEYPIFEEQSNTEPSEWMLYPLDRHTGEILPPPHQNDNRHKMIDHIGQSIPQWQQSVDLVKHAHLSIADIKTVGWDLCITESGPVIIEANSGWGLAMPQIISGTALLESELIEVYK